MFCPNCGKENADEAVYCFDCGSQIVKTSVFQQSENRMFDKCGLSSPVASANLQKNISGVQKENTEYYYLGNVIVCVLSLLTALGFWIISWFTSSTDIKGIYQIGLIVFIVQIGFLVLYDRYYGYKKGVVVAYSVVSVFILVLVPIYAMLIAWLLPSPSEKFLIEDLNTEWQKSGNSIITGGCPNLTIGRDIHIPEIKLIKSEGHKVRYSMRVKVLSDNVTCYTSEYASTPMAPVVNGYGELKEWGKTVVKDAINRGLTGKTLSGQSSVTVSSFKVNKGDVLIVIGERDYDRGFLGLGWNYKGGFGEKLEAHQAFSWIAPSYCGHGCSEA